MGTNRPVNCGLFCKFVSPNLNELSEVKSIRVMLSELGPCLFVFPFTTPLLLAIFCRFISSDVVM